MYVYVLLLSHSKNNNFEEMRKNVVVAIVKTIIVIDSL